jgi:hypothetical protein
MGGESIRKCCKRLLPMGWTTRIWPKDINRPENRFLPCTRASSICEKSEEYNRQLLSSRKEILTIGNQNRDPHPN